MQEQDSSKYVLCRIIFLRTGPGNESMIFCSLSKWGAIGPPSSSSSIFFFKEMLITAPFEDLSRIKVYLYYYGDNR